MGWVKPQHLSQVVEDHGTGAATTQVVRWVEEGLRQANERSQEERAASKGTTDKTNPHISDSSKCVRQVWFSLINEPQTEPLTTDSLVNFAVGHAVEEAFASMLEESGATVTREVHVEIPTGSTKVTGRIDFLVTLPGEKVLIELKSISSRSMGMTLRKGEPGKEEHRHQANLYVHASKMGLLPDEYEKAYLVYLVKDATRREPTIHAFEVQYDKAMAEADLKSLAILNAKAENGMEVPIPADIAQEYQAKGKPPLWPCAYCSWQSRCFK